MKLFIFDLDGTLADSKCNISKSMGNLLGQLQNMAKVAILSGCHWKQFEKQVIPYVDHFNLILMPTCGSKIYQKCDGWKNILEEDNSLTDEEKDNIYKVWNECVNIQNKKLYGNISEDRDTQITFSMLGQKATIEKKKRYDPTRCKRKKIIKKLSVNLKKYDIKIGGTTSIDITRRGINKKYGIKKVVEVTNVDIKDAIFVGDALYSGGNDEIVKSTGIKCISTTSPENTKEIIKDFIRGGRHASF